MRIKFVTDLSTNLCEIKKGDEFEVISKKEPDKFMNYVRYQIRVGLVHNISKINPNIIINIPEIFVEEVREIA